MRTRSGGKVTADQAVAYRVSAHHLHERLPAGGLLDAAAVVGVQDAPPGTAALSLAARVAKLSPGDVDDALHDDRSLLRIVGLRGVPHVVPRSDAGVFGPGGLAADEASLREQLGPAWVAIEASGWTAREALGAVIGVLAAVLADAEPRTKGELSEALHGRLAPELEPWCDACDVHHVPEPLLRLAGTAGIFCYGWPQGSRQMLMATDIWLGEPMGGDVRSARVELARRFVHAYGPVAPRHFASWSGIGAIEARDRFLDLGSELIEVRLDGAPAWVLAADLDELQDPPLAGGARLLPAGDPFLAQRDRSTLVPDRSLQRAVWRPVGSPGLVLMTGHPVGVWHARVVGSRLEVAVEAFTPLGERQRTAIEQTAGLLAFFRGQGDVAVRFL
jgi:Winged helix DNA-binding domain